MTVRIRFVAFLIVVLGVPQGDLIGAQDIAQLQSGVVKITAKPPQGTANIGTGFIVRLETNVAYIVTAAHVVAGDPQPKVEFFTKRNLPVMAEVLGLEGDDELRGLALLVVRGSENLPTGLKALSLAGAAHLSGGEDIIVIGFPRNAGPWALVKGNISSRQGRDVYFSPSVDSGHSGGPVFQGDKVVAVVGAGSQTVGRGITVRSVQDYMEGFGVTAQGSTGTVSAGTEPSSPPAATAKLEPRQLMQDREITGRDGAPMVLIPAGEFWMGSSEGEGKEDEYPRHQVFLDAFYMDKFEVTVSRYHQFIQSTNRSKPEYWDQVDINVNGNLPIIGVNWHDAESYCRWAGKRLPTEAEWEKAARGKDERTWPWGNQAPASWLAKFGQTSFGLTGYVLRVYVDGLESVDSYEAGKSPYGLRHMAGNAEEWVADWYEENYYRESLDRNPKGPSNGQYRVLRGGWWGTSVPFWMRSANREHRAPADRFVGLGFRCARDIPK